jgi:two-component system LytT family sensor kinase
VSFPLKKLPSKYVPWVAGVAVWTVLPLLFASQTAIWFAYRGQPMDWGEHLTFRLADWYTCGLFIPLLVWATRRWPVDLAHLGTRLPLQLALVVAVSAAKIVLFEPVQTLLGLTPRGLGRTFAAGFISEIVAFGATSAAIHAIEFYRRFRERELLAQQLQARLTDAQLRALRAQLNPHFLFNTLNSITTLVHRDPHRADAMLTRLGELLRLTLRADPDHEIPLAEEFALLDRYLDIMRMRFSDRVTVSCTLHPAVANALVPSFVLQPLAENAFEHGVARASGAVRVDVEGEPSSDGKFVTLRVRDDGPGLSGSGSHVGGGLGLGLGNTRLRLEEMYAGAATLRMTTPAEGGTLVEVRIPFRAAKMPAGAFRELPEAEFPERPKLATT